MKSEVNEGEMKIFSILEIQEEPRAVERIMSRTI
jgi:hypothetical protein